MALTKADKDMLLYLLRTLLFDILCCEIKQHSEDRALLLEAFKVYCKIKKEINLNGEEQ